MALTVCAEEQGMKGMCERLEARMNVLEEDRTQKDERINELEEEGREKDERFEAQEERFEARLARRRTPSYKAY